jgi:hypothetical protein
MAQQAMTAKLIRGKCQPETGASIGKFCSYKAILKTTLFNIIPAYMKRYTLFFLSHNSTLIA